MGPLTVKTEQAVHLLAKPVILDWKIGKKDKDDHAWEITGSAGLVSATFHMGGSLKAELSKLDVSASLTFNLSHGALRLDRSTSSVQLEAEASGHMEFTAGLTVGVIIPIPFINTLIGTSAPIFAASLKGALDPTFKAKLVAHFDKPTELFKPDSRAGLIVPYLFKYAKELLPGKVPNEESFEEFADGVLGPIALFGLGLPEDL